MPYGVLTSAMEKALAVHVANRVVYDLGAGDLGRSIDLVRLGAKKVVAVEKSRFRPAGALPEQVEFRWKTFEGLLEELGDDGIEVAFLGWPENRELTGLIQILEKAETVCYLGINDGFTACGWPALFRYLSGREVKAEVAYHLNNLLVYGRHFDGRRVLRPEEKRALSISEEAWSLYHLAQESGLLPRTEDRTHQEEPEPQDLETEESRLEARR